MPVFGNHLLIYLHHYMIIMDEIYRYEDKHFYHGSWPAFIMQLNNLKAADCCNFDILISTGTNFSFSRSELALALQLTNPRASPII